MDPPHTVSVDIAFLKRTIERLSLSFRNIAWANVSNYDFMLASTVRNNLEMVDYVIQRLGQIVREGEKKYH